MLLTMTDSELLRIKLIQDICDKRLTGVEAARLLKLSPRQVYRLVKRFIELGASGLVSLKCGQPGNHRHDDKLKFQTLALLHQRYSDFGPSLAHEKLSEDHDIHVSVETLRQWMIADGLWIPHAKRKTSLVIVVVAWVKDGMTHHSSTA
ncbi:helix-turn-helix domain-containing protein [Photobacterium sp. 1_MG-2023]|uniref:helix-turn-helix domain-containing protein n=1 Tax=Photobacterium sp. 1_MG-2023 TaxID=3062646 RepID=UPI0026E32ADE|nr:helix-turn-helix domain-containing protein [Photobacterium sp. 1_MG-2023]MDO6707008.1 helix-turn-helix domain-containing protein [Photobacterium sp. 1_MG-2023]